MEPNQIENIYQKIEFSLFIHNYIFLYLILLFSLKYQKKSFFSSEFQLLTSIDLNKEYVRFLVYLNSDSEVEGATRRQLQYFSLSLLILAQRMETEGNS